MNRKEYLDNYKEILQEFVALARQKKYHEETIKIACILAGSKEMHEKYGDTLQATKKAIELCNKHKNGNEFIRAFMSLLEKNKNTNYNKNVSFALRG